MTRQILTPRIESTKEVFKKMKDKCCGKHKKSCGQAGRYKTIWDSYCCSKCPELLKYNKARQENNEQLQKKYEGKVFCKTCVVKNGSGIFDSQEKLNEHIQKEHSN